MTSVTDGHSISTRLIDWDFAFAQPLQKCAVLPKLLENVPGGAPPELAEELAYVDLAADKFYFLSVLAEKERERSKSLGVTMNITKLIETSSERNFFELSHHVATIHKEFVARFCVKSRENLKAAMEELDRFVGVNAEFSRDDVTIVEIRKNLEEQLEQAY